jgi:exosortase E/protease (VPEID-CTERM system)
MFDRRDWLALIAISALLLVELMGLSLRFDAKSILPALDGAAREPGIAGSSVLRAGDPRIWLVWLVGHAGFALKAALVAASAAVIFAGRRLRRDLLDLDESSFIRWSGPAFAAHVASYAAFVGITGRLFEGGAGAGPWAAAWFAAWLSMGALVMVSLVAIAIPTHLLGLCLKHLAKALAVGGLVGTVAVVGGQLANRLWKPLGYGTLQAVHGLLRVFDSELLYRPAEALVGTKSFDVSIAPECSGYEGIGLVLTFLGLYLWIFRDRFRLGRVWLLLPLGAVTIWLANVVRIVALILVGTYLSPEVAVSGFHSQAGWIAFNAVTLGLIAVAAKCPFFARDDVTPVPRSETETSNREAVYLAPLMSIVLASMIGGAFSTGGLDRFYPIRLAAVAIPLWLYRRSYASMKWSCSWQAVAIGILVFGIWVARWPGGLETHVSHGEAMVGTTGFWTILWLAARALGSIVTVPLAEELAFRGFLTRRLISADFESVPPGRFAWIPFLVSSVAFGMLHGRWLEGTLAGMLFAIAYYRRGSIGDAVVAHATTNAMLSAEALITGDWSLWS